jgi:hypothetical protein
MGDQLAPSERHVFTHEGRVVYEWDQTLEEVNVYVSVPAGVRAAMLDVKIQSTTVSIGIKGNPPYLEHELTEPVKTEESFWTLADSESELHVQLQKRERGKSWPCVFRGHGELDFPSQQAEKQRLMKERFQLEHPGFDFSGAEFNGDAPDASKFMGGVGHAP